MQGNNQANYMGSQALQQNYQVASNDLYGMGGAGFGGGAGMNMGNMGAQFGVSGGFYAGAY
jgi:hypothetical protein